MTIHIMTYNLRVGGSAGSGPHTWEKRRPLMKKLLQNYTPDVLCTQEGTYWQLTGLEEDLLQYDWIGLGREGGSKGEFMAVFFRKDKYRAVDFDHFWLSETPAEIGSVSWETACPRMATWVFLEDRGTKETFYVMNTHLDHISVRAREEGAALLVQERKGFQSGVPVILTGDFNTHPGSRVYEILTGSGELFDSWRTADERKGSGLGTFNDFTDENGGGEEQRIDWVLVSESWEVEGAEIVDVKVNDEFPSDHYPVYVKMGLKRS
ncbi:endonuclease/exonuclease/phosphatase family protein [Fictibacillus sp. KIGAM418]|uniref:Endonuclease/exonuclease/phosphatase family protein n=1 Tax=Fictibacillus marinisediminis TaxID=2878389 RepID=A0A9X2BEJ4_9BACL|nr:endonuclease/exonuclease/phosphatase family protein [Fictibacillus marinisediminis]MCK6259089.1 endonuclease/exonuclease/phosphatase family protein [Fictibacillus marinisediminis]